MRKYEGRDNAANKKNFFLLPVIKECNQKLVWLCLLLIFSIIQQLSMEFPIRGWGIALEWKNKRSFEKKLFSRGNSIQQSIRERSYICTWRIRKLWASTKVPFPFFKKSKKVPDILCRIFSFSTKYFVYFAEIKKLIGKFKFSSILKPF